MSVELLASGVFIVEEDPKISALPSIPTAVLGAVGVTEMGPFERTLAQSWPEWYGLFGGQVAVSDLSIAAAGYFLNGGKTLWTKRTCHYSPNVNDEANRQSATAEVALTTTGAATQGSETSTNAAPFNLTPGDDVDVKVDGGGTQTATWDAAAAAVTGTGGTYPTGWSSTETLIFTLDSGVEQTITFPGSSHTLAQVIDYINPRIEGGYADDNGGQLRITSDKQGTGSRVQIGAGTANTELGFAGTEDQSGTGDVVDINAVTATEIKTVIEADTTAEVVVEADDKVTIRTPTVGAGGSIQVEASSTADDEIGWDNDVHSGSAAGPGDMGKVYGKYEGAYANALKAVVAAASSGDSDEFNLSITKNDVVVEVWPNLSTTLTHDRYWVTIINTSTLASKLVTVEDLLTGTPPDNRPDNGSYTLVGGDDGLTGLDDNDFIGSAAGGTGLYGLDQVDNLTLLIVPGRGTAAVHQAMLDYCETYRKGRVFAILDPPANNSATQIVTYVKTTAALKGYSEHGAIFWPRGKIQNPDKTEFTSDANGLITVAMSGHIAGVFARTDASKPGGIYEYPAGIIRGKISGCLGFETDEVLDEEKRKLVYPERINPIMAEGGSVRHIDGSRTLKSTGHFPFIAQRRGASHIENTIRIGLQFARHARNTRALRSACFNTAQKYLLTQMAVDAFRTKKASTAFGVNFSDGLNPPSVEDSGQLIGQIGLNMAPPAEFIILYFSQDTRALDAEIAESTQGR